MIYKIVHYTKGKETTVFYTGEFNKLLLQKEFDNRAVNLEIGEELEYMKENAKNIYPSLLHVEMTSKGLITFNKAGIARKYKPKF